MAEYLLIGLLVLEAIIHHFERRDLYNRIMSKDITDYKTAGKKKTRVMTAHQRALAAWREKGGDNK